MNQRPDIKCECLACIIRATCLAHPLFLNEAAAVITIREQYQLRTMLRNTVHSYLKIRMFIKIKVWQQRKNQYTSLTPRTSVATNGIPEVFKNNTSTENWATVSDNERFSLLGLHAMQVAAKQGVEEV
jgi:hypothetical protein